MIMMGCSSTCPSWKVPATAAPSGPILGASTAASAFRATVAVSSVAGSIGVAPGPCVVGGTVVVADAVGMAVGAGSGGGAVQVADGFGGG